MIEIGEAQGRLKNRSPVAVIDIGSNSVRLVIFEGLVRAPSLLFNEKVSCGLGRGIASDGRMTDESVTQALAALSRFKALSQQANVVQTFVLATAAAREAENGPDFVARAEAVLGEKITILSGKEEALYSAHGVMSAFRVPDGVVGDLGGGSLELVDVRGTDFGSGVTLPLGVIRLEERANGDIKQAQKTAAKDLTARDVVDAGAGRKFYAVGGTWRNIAKLHMEEIGYPLHITHAYEVDPDELSAFLRKIIKHGVDDLGGIDEVSKSRRTLMPYGAIVLDALIHAMKPRKIVFSAFGVREGFIYSQLDEQTQRKDALIEAADELAVLRARSPRHARELADWTADAFRDFGIDETVDEQRYREAACRMADIGWRAHPDYRAAQSLAVLAYGHFVQISHQGRAYIALASYFRYQGLKTETLAPEILKLTDDRIWMRARLLAALFRVAYLFTAAMPGIIGELSWREEDDGSMSLILPKRLHSLAGERPEGRIAQLAKIAERDIQLLVEDAPETVS